MKIGMLWFDNTDQPLSTKVRAAVKYYQMKYGETPNVIMCNPKDYVECQEFAIQTDKYIRINHLWIGVKND